MSAKVCVMTDVHWVFDNRINKEISTLVKAGYEVYYVAPASEEEAEKYASSHPNVRLVPIHRYENRHERMRKGVREAYKAALLTNADIYHFHDPELITAGIKLKLLKHKKIVYDVHEDYVSDILSKEWIPKLIRRIYSLGYLVSEKISSFLFDGIIIVVPEIMKRFNKRKTIILPNYPDLTLLSNLEDENKKDGFIFGHLGGLHVLRSIKEIVEAFKIAKDKASSKLFLLFVGKIEDEESKWNVNALKNEKEFIYISRKPYEKALQIMKGCNAGLIVLKPTPNTVNASPNKLFEYMGLGLPIIASDFSKWHEILDEAKCAVYVDPLDVNDIADKMLYLANNPEMAKQMGKRGKKLVFEKYTWSVVEKRLLSLYHSILDSGK